MFTEKQLQLHKLHHFYKTSPTNKLIDFLDVRLDVSFDLFDLVGVGPYTVRFKESNVTSIQG